MRSTLALRLGLRLVSEADLEAWERERDVDAIAQAARDPRRRIRLAAVRALGRLGAARPLRAALRDRARVVSLAAAEAVRPYDPDAAAATVERWRRVAMAGPQGSGRKLIDTSKMTTFARFKAQVLAQASRGQFYG